MACRKAAHTHADRAITRPSDVTSESKIDANAGTTAASGCGNPVHGLVGHVEVAALLRNAVVGESGLSRTCAEAQAVVRAKARTELRQRLCAARQSRPVCGDVRVMPHRAGTKGLRGFVGRVCDRRPRQEMCGRRSICERRLPWLAAMRLEVAAWESSFLWQQTDDEHSTCAFMRRECSAEVLLCGHYELGGCTEENSAA